MPLRPVPVDPDSDAHSHTASLYVSPPAGRPRSNSFSMGSSSPPQALSPSPPPSASTSPPPPLFSQHTLSSNPPLTHARTPSPPQSREESLYAPSPASGRGLSPTAARPMLTLDLTVTPSSSSSQALNEYDVDDEFLAPNPTLAPPTGEDEGDMYFDDEGLGPLEKIYLFSRSRAVFHRVFISHSLPGYLSALSPYEAVEYVLPLLNGLGTDSEDSVREAFVAELVAIMWWFFTHCRVTDGVLDDDQDPDAGNLDPTARPRLPVQVFTPLLGSLLLSPNPIVGDTTRWGIVQILARLHHSSTTDINASATSGASSSQHVLETPTPEEKDLIRREIIEGVIIGMARLDFQEYEEEQIDDAPPSASGPVRPPFSEHSSSSTTGSSSSTSIPTMSSTSSSESPPPPESSKTPDPTDEFDPEYSPPTSERTLRATEAHNGGNSDFAHSDTEPALSAAVNGAMVEDFDAVGGEDVSEEAAIGRVASMSLIAAVTASGHLDDEAKSLFVQEVARVGHDSIFWVRREVAFALGALLKVVHTDLVKTQLLPLYETFITDPTWHVRHSALFALPGLLVRLSSAKRRALAVSQFATLATDSSRSVRSGLLEILGEVIYTFAEDEGGPPRELIDMFVSGDVAATPDVLTPTPHFPGSPPRYDGYAEEEEEDNGPFAAANAPDRELICAFNFPAVTLTLGRGRWDADLRLFYLELTMSENVRVRCTLAASLGEVAKIIGPRAAARDLVGVMLGSLRDVEEEVRTKAVEALPVFLEGLEDHERGRGRVAGELEGVWASNLRGWREREGFANLFGRLSGLLARTRTQIGGEDEVEGGVATRLVLKALVDGVAAVREAAISQVPVAIEGLGEKSLAAGKLREGITALALSGSYRQRATFVTCCQTLVMHPITGESQLQNKPLWDSLVSLSNDAVVDVRIGIARLISNISDTYFTRTYSPSWLTLIARTLSHDTSAEVRSYVYYLSDSPVPSQSSTPSSSSSNSPLSSPPLPLPDFSALPPFTYATFSKPPTHESKKRRVSLSDAPRGSESSSRLESVQEESPTAAELPSSSTDPVASHDAQGELAPSIGKPSFADDPSPALPPPPPPDTATPKKKGPLALVLEQETRVTPPRIRSLDNTPVSEVAPEVGRRDWWSSPMDGWTPYVEETSANTDYFNIPPAFGRTVSPLVATVPGPDEEHRFPGGWME